MTYSEPVLGLATAIVCLSAAIPHLAGVRQPPSGAAYIALIERYQRGDDDAIVSVATLDAKAIESGERALIKIFEEAPGAGARGRRLLRAAIVAHTDTAISRRSGLTAIAWAPHLSTAERYVEALATKDCDDPVVARWWFIAIGAMHAQRNYSQAMTVARRALRVCGERAEFLFAIAVTHELAWAWQHEEGYRSAIDGSLQEAEKAYTRVLEQDPKSIEARVRLGRVQMLRGDTEAAVRTLAAVPDSAPTALVFLTRLFEGEALERLGRSAQAQERYQAAIRLVPQAQSAQLALAYSEYQGGARADAAGRVHESTSDRRAAEDGDPWFWYSMGFAAFASRDLELIRSAVRQ